MSRSTPVRGFLKKLTNSLNLFIVVSIVIILILIVLLNVLFDVEDVQADRTTRIYYADNISPAHRELIRLFNQEYRNKIEVIPVNLPFTKFSTNERKELLARTLRSKSGKIDLFTVDIIWVPRFAKWCQPLDRYFPQEWREEIIEHVLESCYFDGRLVAMPLYTDIGLMYYRRDLLARLPHSEEIAEKLKNSITWEEFLDLYQQFLDRKIFNPFYIFPADNYEGLICSLFEGFARSSDPFVSGNSVQLNTPAVRRSLQLLTDLVNRYSATPGVVTNFDEFQGYLYALEHDAIFIRGWPGFLKHYRDTVPDTTKLALLGKVALPHFRGEKPAFVYGGWNFMVSKFSKKTDAAVQFIKFCLREDNQKLLFQKGGYIPIRKSVYQATAMSGQESELRYYYQLLQNGVHRPYLKDYTKISDVLSYYAHLAIRKEISIEEALNKATERINTKQVLIK